METTDHSASSWRSLPTRRKPVTMAVVIVVTATLVCVVCLSILTWLSPLALAERLGLIGDVIAVATFLLACLAAALGLLAYLVATQTPELEPEIRFRYSDVNRPVFRYDEQPA